MNNKIDLYRAYWRMTKPGIMIMVLVTTALGFYFADHGIHKPFLLFWTLMGSALTCG
jgi:heme O synthase-like polyprenyltransferase